MTLRLLAVCLVLLAHTVSQAQTSRVAPPPDTSKGTIGIFGDGSLNIHRANFQTLPDVPNCCPLFQNGSGLGGEFGLFYDYDAFGGGHLGVRAGLNLLGGKLTATEPVSTAVNISIVNGTIEHDITSQFTLATLEPYYAAELGGLRLMVGASLGYVLSTHYDQVESIKDPADQGVFLPDSTRTRNVFSGAIPEAVKVRIGLIAGLSYPLPLNSSGTLHLIPEAFFDYGLTQMVTGLSWTVSALRAGVSIGYTPIHIYEPPPPPPPIVVTPPPPPPPPPPALAADVKVYSISSNGVKDSTDLSITIEEFYSMTRTPLLPFVLFGLDDAKIPDRYHNITPGETADFDVHETDSTDNVRVYHDLLNIIGKRMREHPNAKLTLTGCTSNEPEELADRKLADTRAIAVARYLNTVWSIPSNRISLTSRGLPAKPSSLTEQDGKEENRRVEIAASDPAILAPVTLSDTTLVSNPPVMRFVPVAKAQAGVKTWGMYVTQPVMTLHREFGHGTPKGWEWDLQAVSSKIPRTEDTIEYGLDITDSTGQEVESIGTIPVRQTTLKKKEQERLADKVIERYTLVLFDFGASKIDPQNQRAIEYIHSQLTPGTKALITGYADRTGEDTLNLRLTEDRAKAVAAMLGAANADVTGVGKSILLFDNNIPEGRFYSRTVNIVLQKPINRK